MNTYMYFLSFIDIKEANVVEIISCGKPDHHVQSTSRLLMYLRHKTPEYQQLRYNSVILNIFWFQQPNGLIWAKRLVFFSLVLVHVSKIDYVGSILDMGSANGRWRYTSSFIGWAYAQNDSCCVLSMLRIHKYCYTPAVTTDMRCTSNSCALTHRSTAVLHIQIIFS